MSTSLNDLYRADAAVGPRDTPGVPELVLYQVNKRFVDTGRSIPKEQADVMYYALSIGHHTGIVDCLEERLRCPLSLMGELLAGLPADNAFARKLRVAYEHGEAYIDKDDLPALVAAVDELVGTPDKLRGRTLAQIAERERVYTEDGAEWLREFQAMLDVMMANWDASIVARRRGL